MSLITKPMLASTLDEDNPIKELVFPLLATPKLDGIRCLTIDSKVLSRKFKPIPNVFIRTELEKIGIDDLDGEILSGTTFQECSGNVMRHTGEPEFVYFVFDYVKDDLTKPYIERMKDLEALTISDNRVVKLIPVVINSIQELNEFETKCLSEGYEGVMLRSPKGGYKCGRATPKQQWLMKLKQFSDSEAIITGFEAKTHNGNEAKKDAFGRTERSTAKAGLVELDTLGTILVRDMKSDISFRIGSGFDDAMRLEIWKNREVYLNKIVKYKHFEQSGMKIAPRFPIFLGFRHTDDM